MNQKTFLPLTLFAALTGGGSFVACAQAPNATASAALQQNFETLSKGALAPVDGRNMTGSTFTVARAKNARGEVSKVARVDYRFSSDGWVELHFAPPLPVPGDVLQNGGNVVFSAQIRGAGRPDFGRASLRFTDAQGEVFQYPAKEMLPALNGSGWRRVRVALNLNQVTESWGAEGVTVNKKLDLPLRFLGMAFNHTSDDAKSGSFSLDDITLRAAPSGAVPMIGFTTRQPLFIWAPKTPIAFTANIGYGVPNLETFEPPAGREYSQADFNFLAGGSKAEGSAVFPALGAADKTAVHDGRGALRLDYKLGGGGYLEIQTRRPLPLTNLSRGEAVLKLWVRGAGKPAFTRVDDFTRVLARFTDARGEMMQFPLNAEAVAAFNGSVWRETTSRLDFSRITESWGDNADKIADFPLTFSGFALEGNGADISGSVFLDDLTIAPANAQPTLKSALHWEARDLNGALAAQGDVPLNLAWGKSVTAPIQFTPRAQGFYSIEGTIAAAQSAASTRNADDGIMASGETRAAVFSPRAKSIAASPYLIGVASHPTRVDFAQQQQEIELMRRAGFAACRFDFVWGDIEPEQGKFNWQATDRLIDLMLKNGIEPLPVVGFSTLWATTGNTASAKWQDWNNAPPRVAAYTDFLRASVAHFKNRIRYWEVWNEPDLGFWNGTREQYSELLNASVRAIHETDASAKVMNGGFTQIEKTMPFKIETLRAAPALDIVAIHAHGTFSEMKRDFDNALPRLRAVAPKIPFWLNEAGQTTTFATERAQAMTVVKKIAFAPALGFRNYVWYDLRDDGTNGAEPEENFGLVRRDFSPKPALIAAHTTLDLLNGKRFARRLEIGESVYALLYEGARESVLVLWKENGATAPMTLKTDARAAFSCDAMGVSTRNTLAGGALKIDVSDDPQFITLTPKTAGAKVALTAP